MTQSCSELLSNDFLIGAAIGSGSAALAAERGGADLLLAISAGRLRNMGAPSIASMLPIVCANSSLQSYAFEEILSQCSVPVLLGVNVWAQSIDSEQLVNLLHQDGFAGAVNFPSFMHYPPSMQKLLSNSGRGIVEEINLLSAVQEAGMLSMFYCATREQARLAATIGLQHICLNLGWNMGGAMGHSQRISLEEAATVSHEIRRLVRRINPDARLLIEGGPIVTAADLGGILKLTQIDGYVGGSTFERLPLETSVAEEIDQFRNTSRQQAVRDQATQELVSWAEPFGFVGHCSAQIEFLRRLKHLLPLPNAKLFLSEQGSDQSATTRAFESTIAEAKGGSVVMFDANEELSAAKSRVFLFGHRDSLPETTGAVNDPNIDLLIIRSVESLAISVQQKLARAIANNSFLIPGTRRNAKIHPEILFVSEWVYGQPVAEEGLIQAGFEPELASQLHGYTLVHPPLRERVDDIFDIMHSQAVKSGWNSAGRSMFSPASRRILRSHHWSRNESEIKQLLGILIGRRQIAPVTVDETRELLKGRKVSLSTSLTDKDRVVDALLRHGFNRGRSADDLGISRKTLYNKMKRYGLSG